MKIWKVILAVSVIFIAGVLTGAVGYSDRFALRQHRAPAREGGQRGPGFANPAREPGSRQLPLPGPPQLPLLRKDFVDRLGRELHLTPAQREHIEKIISDGQERTRELWKEVEPQVREELQAVKGRIRAELTAEQQGRFEELMKRPQRKPDEAPALDRPARGQRQSPPPRDRPPREGTPQPAPSTAPPPPGVQ